jgi:hypothetical protein
VVAVKTRVQRIGEARWVVLWFLQKNNRAVGRRQRESWPEVRAVVGGGVAVMVLMVAVAAWVAPLRVMLEGSRWRTGRG